MSCYFRHLKDIFNEAGTKITSSSRKQIDRTIHDIVEVTYQDCPNTWKKLKQKIIGDEQKRLDFIKELRDATL